jgi:hypothetical protein
MDRGEEEEEESSTICRHFEVIASSSVPSSPCAIKSKINHRNSVPDNSTNLSYLSINDKNYIRSKKEEKRRIFCFFSCWHSINELVCLYAVWKVINQIGLKHSFGRFSINA